MTTPNETTALAVYMKKPEVLAKFSDVLGDKNSAPYVQSVLITVSESPELLKCSNESIFRSALRAASLGLSCDKSLKQAWIVPYWNNKKKVVEAQFQPHYRGLYTLAMRTGKYWNINVSPVYEGQRVLENPLTGLHLVQESNGFVGDHPGKNPGYNDVTNRRRSSEKVIGWLGYFKTKKGFEKSVWMSSQEIDDHARKYVKEYEKNQNWNDPDKRGTMEMKTVLRQLLSWADMSGTESAQLMEALQEDETIDAPADEVIDTTVADPNTRHMTIEEAREVKEPFNNTAIGSLAVVALNSLYLSDEVFDTVKEAAAMVLKVDYNMDPPLEPKRTEAQIKGQMGF